MFVPLFFFKTGLLSRPTFYISAFFERNREEYYDRLLAVSRAGAWTEWVVFFLKALRAQAEVNQRKAVAILDLYEDFKKAFADLSRSQYCNSRSWISCFANRFSRPPSSSSVQKYRHQPPRESSDF